MLPGTGCRTAAGLLPGTLPALRTAQRLLGLFLGLADGIAVELAPVQGIQIIGKAAENRLVVHPSRILRHGRAAPFVC